MKTIQLILVSALFISINAFAAKSDCENDSKYGEVTKNELNLMIADRSAFVIDVNSKDSYKEEHIPTAIHFETEKARFEKILPKDKNALIVAYCGGPACTAWKKAAHEACKLGYTNVKHFKPGIKGWKKG